MEYNKDHKHDYLFMPIPKPESKPRLEDYINNFEFRSTVTMKNYKVYISEATVEMDNIQFRTIIKGMAKNKKTENDEFMD